MASVQSACIRFLLSRANLWNKPIAEIRESLKKVKPQGIPSGVSEEFVSINGVNCKVLIPAESLNKKAILYFHGGGFCLGIYHPNREFVARMAKKCGVKVFMPNYRLAPGKSFSGCVGRCDGSL